MSWCGAGNIACNWCIAKAVEMKCFITKKKEMMRCGAKLKFYVG
jgi:hypothetical protein